MYLSLVVCCFQSRNCKQNIKSWIETRIECLRWRLRTQFILDTETRNNTLDKVSSFKYFGVWNTKDLSWSKHVSEVCIKAKMVIG